MDTGRGVIESELLLITDDQSFGSAVVDAVEETEMAMSATHVDPTGGLRELEPDDIEGVIIDSQIAEPAAVVTRFTGRKGLPVIVLADAAGDEDRLAQAIRAGATDVFPRTTTSAQYELVVDRLVVEDSAAGTRVLAENETTYSEAYEALFEKISEGLVVHDPETGTVVDVNERFCEMNGYDRSELVGEHIDIVTAPEEAYGLEKAEEMIQRARTEGPQQFEWRNQRRDGETFPVEVNLTVIELEDTERVLASVKDITERKRREQEYEQIFNGVNDAISVHDTETAEILEVNDRFCTLLGYDAEEIVERGMEVYLPDYDGYTAENARKFVRTVVEAGEPRRTEWAIETSDGEIRWLEAKGTTVDTNGERRYVSINRDITERRHREQRLEVFNRVLRHNLRNQLDVIRGHAEELADRTANGHADQIVRSVDTLAGIGRRARNIDQIISSDDRLTTIDLSETLRDAVDGVEPTQRDVTVSTEFPDESRLRTSEDSVTMAVECALENAVEHAAQTVTIAIEEGPDECIITIADDGPGIPEEELIPIEAETETRLQHGRGLGLWQLRWCVDNLNGELSFETDTGTTVRITVPDRHESGRPD
jgi:PAS domain S-box/PAS domain S-box